MTQEEVRNLIWEHTGLLRGRILDPAQEIELLKYNQVQMNLAMIKDSMTPVVNT